METGWHERRIEHRGADDSDALGNRVLLQKNDHAQVRRQDAKHVEQVPE